MASSPLLLFKSGSFRRPKEAPRDISGTSPDSATTQESTSPLRLRRVFTTHACRRANTRKRDVGFVSAGTAHGSPVQWRMASLMKKPLGVAHSVPLGPGFGFNRSVMSLPTELTVSFSHSRGTTRS